MDDLPLFSSATAPPVLIDDVPATVYEKPELNDPQRLAVENCDGPLLILAGAGSGKTRVITYRIAHLVQNGVSPFRIMALTFTNKAAAEMKERASEILRGQRVNSWISTFHSACLRILRKDADRLNYPKDFTVYDANDQSRLIKACLAELGLTDKEHPARQLGSMISRYKSAGKGPVEAENEYRAHRDEVFARVFQLYETNLQKSRCMDFDDLLAKTVTLLRDHKPVRDYYTDRFTHLMVDEFQDTNGVQYDLVKLLTGPDKNICVVGDDDQSIYRWRGAEVGNFSRFERDYHPKIIKLEQNYRSAGNILKAANAVVSKNLDRKEKKLWTGADDGELIKVYTAEDEVDEAHFVANTIKSALNEGSRSLNEFAIFYRTNSQSRTFEDALRRNGTAYKIFGGLKFYDRKEIKDILAWFKAILNPFDLVSFKRIINTPPRGVGTVTVEKLEELAVENGLPLIHAIEDEKIVDQLSLGASKKVHALAEIIGKLRAITESSPAVDAIGSALTETGYLTWLEEEEKSEARTRMENLQELENAAEEFAQTNGDTTMSAFLDHASLLSDADNVDEQAGSVKLMTVHVSKGLEFPMVFVTGLEDKIFPHARSLGDPAQMGEERRLMYVAMTRAREVLHLTHARSRRIFGVGQRNKPSEFLADIPPAVCKLDSSHPVYRPTGYEGPRKAPIYKPAVPQNRIPSGAAAPVKTEGGFAIGMKVVHKTFQVGVIRKIDGVGEKCRLTIYFPRFGEKKLIKKFAGLLQA